MKLIFFNSRELVIEEKIRDYSISYSNKISKVFGIKIIVDAKKHFLIFDSPFHILVLILSFLLVIYSNRDG